MNKPLLSLFLFGTPRLIINDEPYDFRLRKGKALLAVLAVEAGPKSRDSLATMLWPDYDQARARTNLRRTLSRLNQTPFTDWLDADSEHISLNPGEEGFIDVREFSELVQKGGVDALQQSADLYQDDFLSDFYLGDNELFEDWAVLQRESYRRQALDGMHSLVELYMEERDYGSATTVAHHQLELDRLRESAWRQLMAALAMDGRRSEALAYHEQLKQILEQELGVPPSPETEQLQRSILEGSVQATKKIQGYQIEEKIGEGRLGFVYRAHQPTIQREVAIKEINPRYANQPEFIRRFEAEAQLIASLEHPRIAPIYDYWREPDRAYLVMRYFRGGSLIENLKAGPYDPAAAAALVDQVASGLIAAHRQGIVHRDLKPANILIDEAGQAYLSDFGIAIDPQQEGSMSKTRQLGYSTYVAPEQLLNEPVTPQTDIYSLGLILYELLSGEHPFAGYPAPVMVEKILHEQVPYLARDLADLPDALDDVIQRATEKKPADRYLDVREFSEALRKVAGSMGTAAGESLTPFEEVPNPYRGLRAYKEADAGLFFGREKATGMLVEQMKTSRLICTLGPSGSGKSSLVNAGLLPTLRRGALSGSENWYITTMVPGTHPFEELEAALLRVAASPPGLLLDQLIGDERGLTRAVKRILPQDGTELLLWIDQFEELFTLVEDDQLRSSFISSLEAAARDAHSRIRIVLALRADFYDRPLRYQTFGELLHSNAVAVVPPSKEELANVIIKPASSVGVDLEESLLATIIADVHNQSGVFPLLQYTLTELFDCREKNHMSLCDYEAMGGVSGSLGRRAEEIFLGLDSYSQLLAKQVFVRLVNISDETEDTRRRALRSELISIHPSAEPDSEGDVNQVIDLFGEYRLLTFDHQAGTREPTVEVAHEALLGAWTRLRGWLDESRADLRMQRVLGNAAAEWIAADRDASFLLRGARLEQYEGWADSTDLALTGDEHAFLDASLVNEAARAAARQKLERRSRNVLRVLVAVFAVAAVVAVMLSLFAFNAQRDADDARLVAENQAAIALDEANLRATQHAIAEEQRKIAEDAKREAEDQQAVAVTERAKAEQQATIADEQRRLAVARELAMAANANLEVDPELSALLAMQSLSTNYTIEAEEALHQAVQNMRITQRYEGHLAYLNRIAYSPDGSLLATTSGDGTLIIWGRDSGQPLTTINSGTVEFNNVAFHPEGKIVATGDSSGSVRLWDVENGAELGSYSVSQVYGEDGDLVEGSGDETDIVGVEFSPDGDSLVAGNFGGTIKVWDITTGEEQILPHLPQLTSLAYHPDGAHLAAGNGLYPGFVSVLDISSGEQRFIVEGGNAISGLAFGPDGQTLASTGYDGNLILWDSTSGEVLSNKAIGGELYNPVFDAEGTRILVGHPNGTAILIDAVSLDEILTLRGHAASVNSVAFSPDGEHATTASSDGVALEWNLGPVAEMLTLQADDGFMRVAYHPGGEQIATTSLSGNVAVWDAQNGDLIWQQDGHEEFAGGLSYSPDGSLLSSSSDVPPIIIVWDSQTGEKLSTIDGHTGYVNNITFSPDGQYLASASEDSTVRLWNMAWQQVDAIKHPVGTWGLAFHPDGRILATSPWDDNLAASIQSGGDAEGEIVPDERVVIWDLSTGEQVMSLGSHSAGIRDVAYSPGGDRLASGAWDGVVTVWDAVTGDRLFAFEAYNGAVIRLAFKPDGSQIATISDSLKIWDANSGDRLLALEDHNALIWGVDYSPDGRYLATASLDGTVRVRVLELDELIELAKNRLTRSWTDDECRAYLHMDSCQGVAQD